MLPSKHNHATVATKSCDCLQADRQLEVVRQQVKGPVNSIRDSLFGNKSKVHMALLVTCIPSHAHCTVLSIPAQHIKLTAEVSSAKEPLSPSSDR